MRRRRILFLTLLGLYLLGMLEVSSRLYWCLGRGVPLFGMRCMEAAYFASLGETQVLRRPVRRDDETFDVLLLGGSVLHQRFGNVSEELERELAGQTKRPVRVHNLGEPGHTTRDSLLKYRLLGRQQFDLVIVYHGINDSRQNNCPRERYQHDYSHCGWYRKLALIDRHPERGWLTLPYSIDCAWVSAMEAAGAYLPRDTPPGGWGTESEDLKTPETFEHNLEAIAAMAESRGDPLVLMTFGHRAEIYLPYPDIVTGISAWGTPKGVLAALNAHNAAVQSVAARHPSIVCIDEAAAIPKTDEFFTDPCHLTPKGCALWAKTAVDALAGTVMIDGGVDMLAARPGPAH